MSEKWRESVFRKITNANELKYLDEFLLNKVGQPGPRASPESRLHLAVLQTVTPKPLSGGNGKSRSTVPTHRKFWKPHACS